MTKLLKYEEGFTLIEMLLALALFGVVMAGLMSFFWFGFSGFERDGNRTELQYSARQARSRILDDFRQSSGFSIKDNAGHEISSGNEGECLYMVMNDGEELKYSVYNNQLYCKSSLSGCTPQPVASYIKAMTFCSPAIGLLEFSIKAENENQAFTSHTSCKGRVD